MNRYVNNWAYTLGDALSVGETVLPLPAGALDRIMLAAGDTLALTIASGFDPLSTDAVEIITLTGQASGDPIVTRGTDPQDWAPGAVIFASLPAEHLNDIQERVSALEQSGGGGGGGGITVGDVPTAAPTAEGEAILANDGLLYIGRDPGDINGWSRFEPLYTEDSSDGAVFTVWDSPSIQRGRWAPGAGYIELSIGPWSSGLDVDAEILLEYSGSDQLVVAGYLSGLRLLSNVAITNNGDGTAGLPVGAAQFIRVHRRADTQTVTVIVEPLQSLQF